MENPQSGYSIHINRTATHYKTHTHAHTYTQTHTLQNDIKPPQYKLKQTQYKIYANETVTI